MGLFEQAQVSPEAAERIRDLAKGAALREFVRRNKFRGKKYRKPEAIKATKRRADAANRDAHRLCHLASRMHAVSKEGEAGGNGHSVT